MNGTAIEKSNVLKPAITITLFSTMKQSDKTVIIGVDIGGTKIQAGAIRTDGQIIGKPVTVDTIGSDDSEIILARITGSVESIMKDYGLNPDEILGIGMGVTGPLDPETGTILECPQLPTMHFYPLRDKIIEKFGLPVIMDNDANALLLGESIWGAGKGFRTTLGFTLGTGLGCAIVIDNKLFTGANGMAGEIWPSPDKEGTIEDIVSGRGVSAVYFSLTKQLRTAKEISILAREGDTNAIEAWTVFGSTLAVALAWGINLIDPGIVILGGSIANSIDLFYDPMESVLRKYICPVPAMKTKVVKAQLGDNAGFIGAAALAIQENF
jgi:glucokinase